MAPPPSGDAGTSDSAVDSGTDAPTTFSCPSGTPTANELCDDFDKSTTFEKWLQVVGSPVLDADATSPPRALAIDLAPAMNDKPAHLTRRFAPGSKIHIELDQKVTTTDTTGEVDTIAIELIAATATQPLDRYGLAFIRNGAKWQIEQTIANSGQQPKQIFEDVIASFEGWRHVIFQVELTGVPRARVVVEGVPAGQLDIPAVTGAQAVDIKVGVTFTKELKSNYKVRLDNVVLKTEGSF